MLAIYERQWGKRLVGGKTVDGSSRHWRTGWRVASIAMMRARLRSVTVVDCRSWSMPLMTWPSPAGVFMFDCWYCELAK